MALPRFFERIYASAGGVLALSRASLEQQLGAVSIGIALDTEWADAPNAVRTAEMLVGLCTRLYGALVLDGPDEWVVAASELARAINPDVALGGDEPTVRVVIGNRAWGERALYVRADGWVAQVLREPTGRPPGPPNPLSAAAAASLAAAEVFRRVFATHVPARQFSDVRVSLLDFGDGAGADDALVRANIGDVAMVGVGAVGNAAVWCLSQFDKIEGRLALIDAEEVDLTNLQRYVLALDRHVGAVKTELAADALRNSGLSLVPLKMMLEEAAEHGVAETIAVSVDNVEGRRSVQALLPRLAINGWTSERGLGASWHEFGENEPCLACGYHPRGPSPSQYDLVLSAFGLALERVAVLWTSGQGLTATDLETASAKLGVSAAELEPWLGRRIQDLYSDVMCGAVALDLSGGGTLEAVPLAHQSALAGVLMVAELIKRTDPDLRARAQNTPMVVWDDVLHPPPRTWTQRREPRPGCFCSDPIYRRRYAEKWLANAEGGVDSAA